MKKDIKLIEITSDKEIEAFMIKEAERMSKWLEGYELSWYTVDDNYVLYISSVSNNKDILRNGKIPEDYNFGHIEELGEIAMIADDALERVQATGRTLYYRLRKKYPNIKRNLKKN